MCRTFFAANLESNIVTVIWVFNVYAKCCLRQSFSVACYSCAFCAYYLRIMVSRTERISLRLFVFFTSSFAHYLKWRYRSYQDRRSVFCSRKMLLGIGNCSALLLLLEQSFLSAKGRPKRGSLEAVSLWRLPITGNILQIHLSQNDTT